MVVKKKRCLKIIQITQTFLLIKKFLIVLINKILMKNQGQLFQNVEDDKGFFLNFLLAAHRLLHEKKNSTFLHVVKIQKKKEKKEKLKSIFFDINRKFSSKLLASFWAFFQLIFQLWRSGIQAIHYNMDVSKHTDIAYVRMDVVGTYIEGLISTVCYVFRYFCCKLIA